MKTFEQNGRTLSVNDTDHDIILIAGADDGAAVENHLRNLACDSYPLACNIDRANGTRKFSDLIEAHAVSAQVIVEAHSRGLVLLTPIRFTRGANCVTNRVTDVILANSALAQSIQRDLSEAGAYGFLERLQSSENRAAYARLLNRLVASLAMATRGVEQTADLLPAAFLAWMNFFRIEGGGRWRGDLWPTSRQVAFQCLRELAFAYARHSGQIEIATRAPQRRFGATATQYWADIVGRTPTHLEPWLRLFDSWRATLPAFARVYRQMFLYLAKWLDQKFAVEQVINVAGFLSEPNRNPPFAAYMAEQSGIQPYAGSKHIQYLSYARRFSEFIATELDLYRNGSAVFHLATELDVRLAKNEAKREARADKPSEAKSRPLPMRLYRLTEEILAEGEAGWPGQCGLCHEIVVNADGSQEKLYCPVLPTLYQALFHLYLRVGQMKRLDSGEGDVLRFDGIARAWVQNTGPHAGYWRDRSHGSENHGYAHRFDSKPPITGFAVNTNKTGDPYVVPWENAELHRLLYELRLWQERNYPIKGPIGPELYVDGVEEVDGDKLDGYPHIFPLFRLPAESHGGREGSPPNSSRTGWFWQYLMAELERRLNATLPPDEQVQIVKRQKKTGQPYGAKYVPHGLRVAGLTILVQLGVPIEVVSKLIAGHKTILMTLYYVKYDPATVNNILDEAVQARGAAIAAGFVRELKSAKFEAAQRKAAFIHEDGVRAATSMDAADKSQWCDRGIGICPWGGTRCHDGGELLRRDKRPNGREFNVYARVEGGDGNCLLCRHFVSGPAWRTPLWLMGTKRARDLATQSGRLADLQLELDHLFQQQRDETDPIVKRQLSKKIDEHELEQHTLSCEREITGKALWNVHRLLEACDAIDRMPRSTVGEADESYELVVSERDSVVEYIQISGFEQAAILTAASRVYPMLYDAETETARNQFLDTLLFRSGNTPLSFAPLSPEAKRRGFDAFARFVLHNVKQEEILALENGALRLQDLGLTEQAVEAISISVGEPLILDDAKRHVIPKGHSGSECVAAHLTRG